LEALAKVSDFPQARGKRHPLAAILALGCAAALCGASSLTAMSQWRRYHGQELLARLGLHALSRPEHGHAVAHLQPPLRMEFRRSGQA